ncbi:hypothetical protein [Bacillus sp. T33-2]|uniref:hypothetical protein n=1 Tax=Bacillus sp. T33-2 TaxID=2054168 RepID=UPI000C76FB1B|nr:hypothetical protein [Bacillus sp. T33-2]PLR98666.1 hypothetical protein CVD19_04730 [Bacillus sp. T33-2]
MKDKETFYDLERKIRSIPEPDYDKTFTKDTQDIIHENLLQFASSYDKQKKRAAIMSKISIGFVSAAAFVLFAILAFPINEENLNPNDQGQQSEEPAAIDDNDDINQNEPDDKLTDTILYENTEYGFTFILPNSWNGYEIVSDTWIGTSTNQQQNNINENGQILIIRHPEWTKEKPRQDIPIMIFTLNQWSSLEKREFHIGAAPIGPVLLGQNNEYVFALPARYNFASLEGYEEVENILENKPFQPKR